MSQLEQFVNDAIKTESKIKHVEVNEELLIQTISILINAGNILDQIKKHVFYNKPYKLEELRNHTVAIHDATTNLGNINTNNIITKETKLKINPRIFHSIVGIATESTELLEALDIHAENMDNINIAEEFGDIDWYKAIGINELDIKWVTILDTVIKKLKARYPNAFTTEGAVNRNLDNERKILNEMET